MVTEIAPPYYAIGTYNLNFTLRGTGFDGLPDDVVAVPMIRNDFPLELRYNDRPWNVMTMTRNSSTEVTFGNDVTETHSAISIGAILSNNRETIYWVNETRPLP